MSVAQFIFKHINPAIVIILLIFFSNIKTFSTPLLNSDHKNNTVIINEKGLFPITNFSSKDYKAMSQNWAIIQDNRGIMYFGNNAGVLEYDGMNWRTIFTDNESRVRSLAINNDGIIYVGAEFEFGYLSPDSTGKMRYHSLVNHLYENDKEFGWVWSIHANEKGAYFQTPNKIFFWNGEKMYAWKSKTWFQKSYMVNGKYFTRQNNLGLCQIENDSLFLIPGGQIFAKKAISSMIPFKNDQIMIISKKNGLFLLNIADENISIISPFPTEIDKVLSVNRVYNGILLENYQISIGTWGKGIMILNDTGKLVSTFNNKGGLQDEIIQYQFLDKRNNLWLALSKGISRVAYNTPITTMDEKVDLDGTVHAITRHKNILYVGTNSGVYYLAGNMNKEKINDQEQLLESFDPSTFLQVDMNPIECWGLLSFEQENKSILLMALNDGIYQLKSDNSTSLIANCDPWVFLRSNIDRNRVFVGLDNGLLSIYRYNGIWLIEGKVNGIDERVQNLVEDEKGNIWLGTENSGFILLNTPKFENHKMIKPNIKKFNKKNGLPEGPYCVSKGFGKLLFATDKGLYKLADDTEHFTADTSFGHKFSGGPIGIHRLSIDSAQNLWLVTYSEKGFEEVGFVSNIEGHKQWLNTPSIEISKEIIQVIYNDKNNITWLGSADGLFRYNTNKINYHSSKYGTYIRKVVLGNDSVVFWGTYRNDDKTISTSQSEKFKNILPYAWDGILIEFSTPCYDHESNIQFQYYLEGFEKGWSEWSFDTKKTYNNLFHEGTYRFHVRAKNIYNLIGEEDIYEFTVLPPWYRTIWAYSFYIIFVLAFVILLIKIRERNLNNHKKILEEKIKNRTKQLQEKTEKLAAANNELEDFAQVVSHDLKAPLRGINQLAEWIVEDYADKLDKNGKEQLALLSKRSLRMHDLIDATLKYSREGRSKEDKKLVQLGQLVSEIIDSIAPPDNITIEIEVPLPDIYGEQSHLWHLFQNLISNAVKYNDKLKGTIKLGCHTKNGIYEFYISDNGPGIAEEHFEKIFQLFETISDINEYESTGVGLSLCKKIITNYGGKIWVESEIGKGSAFYFTLPPFIAN